MTWREHIVFGSFSYHIPYFPLSHPQPSHIAACSVLLKYKNSQTNSGNNSNSWWGQDNLHLRFAPFPSDHHSTEEQACQGRVLPGGYEPVCAEWREGKKLTQPDSFS